MISDPDAAVLMSPSQRLGWESGRLVSDPIACIPHPLRFSATVFQSRSGPGETLPNLHICSRNVDSNLPLNNCQRLRIQNGLPTTVMAPVPDDVTSPAQVIVSP
jgi:hypothetical protein